MCLGLPDRSEHESDIKTKAFRSLGMEAFGKEDRLEKLIEFMKEMGKDNASSLLNAFETFRKSSLTQRNTQKSLHTSATLRL